MTANFRRIFRFLLLCLGFCFTILLAGCDPRCTPADLIAPIPTGPGQFEIVSNNITFSWEFPLSCVPGVYRVRISDNLYFTNPTVESGGELKRSSSFTRYVLLVPGKQYWWKIVAVAVSEGPPGIEGPYSDQMTFIAGPVCTPADLIAPNLLFPYMGAVVDTAFPILAFETAGNCAANYWVDLQTDENFGGINYLDSTDPIPTTRVTPNASSGLADCTTYFWRVRSTINGVNSPYTPTYNFRTDFTGACTYGQEVVVTPPTPAPTQPEATSTPTPPPEAPEVDRCGLFDQESINLTLLDLAPGTTIQTVYLTIPGGVPGLELAIPGDPGPWEYSATLGSAMAEECTFEGYAERLYCTFELSAAALGTVQELFAYVNDCPDPFFHHQGVSIFEPAPVCTAELPESECIAVGGEFVHVTDTMDMCDCP